MAASPQTVFTKTVFRTVVRSFNADALRRNAFRALSSLAPEWATDAALRRFAHAPQLERSADEWQALADAQQFVVPFVSGRLSAWRWGAAAAPPVLLMHGWGGRGGQLRAFVAPLLGAGFSVLCFDAPGHGLSGPGESSFVHFALALEEVVRRAGPFKGVVAHSMGGAVSAFAMSRGTAIERAVLVAPPASLIEYSHVFASQIGASEAVRRAMQRRMEQRFGIDWADIEAERSLPLLRPPGLVIHDHDDIEVPLAHGRRYARHWPQARLLETRGLGHRRILKDPQVIEAATRFIAHAPG